MPAPSTAHSAASSPAANFDTAISPRESLEYTRQMLDSLKGISEKQGHTLLSQLLGLATKEASAILKERA